MEPESYEDSGRTLVGFCAIMEDASTATSAVWHASGLHGARSLDAPVGTLSMRSLDHLSWPWFKEGGESLGSWKDLATALPN